MEFPVWMLVTQENVGPDQPVTAALSVRDTWFKLIMHCCPLQEEIFNQILQTMPGIATFSSRPKAIRGGTASMCVFRHLSKKEEKAYRESQESHRRDTLNKDDRNSNESDVLCQ